MLANIGTQQLWQRGRQGAGREPGLLQRDAPGDSWDQGTAASPGDAQPRCNPRGRLPAWEGFDQQEANPSSPAHQQPPLQSPSSARDRDGAGPQLRTRALCLLDASTADGQKEAPRLLVQTPAWFLPR